MSSKGKRYTNNEKQEVINFVIDYNARHNGRGGIAHAHRKFGITAMTIKTWLLKDQSIHTHPIKMGGKTNVFQQLASLHAQIEQKRKELDFLTREFNALKKSIDL